MRWNAWYFLEFQPKVGFSLFKMCKILSNVTFSAHGVVTFNKKKVIVSSSLSNKGTNGGKKTAEKDETTSRKAPRMTFVLSCFVHRPAKCGSGEIAKGKSSAGTGETETSDLSLKTTPFKIPAILKMFGFFSPFMLYFFQHFTCDLK